VKLLSDYHNPPMLQTDGQTIHSIAIPRYTHVAYVLRAVKRTGENNLRDIKCRVL